MYFPPRSQEATAAIRHISEEAMNAMRRPWMKGPEMSWGKKWLPVR